MRFYVLRHPTLGDRAYYLAPSAARARALWRADMAVGSRDEAVEISRDDAGPELLAAADARQWREGFLAWAQTGVTA